VCLHKRVRDERSGRAAVRSECPLRELERDHGVDQPLLGAVVEIADDAAAGRIGFGDEARARGGELSAAVGICDRGRHELGERAETALRARRKGLGLA
jgi:hypothetical protein